MSPFFSRLIARIGSNANPLSLHRLRNSARPFRPEGCTLGITGNVQVSVREAREHCTAIATSLVAEN